MLDLVGNPEDRLLASRSFDLQQTAILCAYKCDNFIYLFKKVQVGKDQEKAQSEKDSHSKNRVGKKLN